MYQLKLCVICDRRANVNDLENKSSVWGSSGQKV